MNEVENIGSSPNCSNAVVVGSASLVDCICPVCQNAFKKTLGHYNRAMKQGLNVYCNRTCAGIGRRTSVEEKKAVKAAYDKKIYNTPERQEARKRYFQKSYKANPEKYKAIRKAKYPKHLEYLQNPKYKAWKKEYDKKHLAKKDYGAFAEAAILLKELEEYLLTIRPDVIKFQMGITNKTQKRKRLWQRTKKQQKNLLQQI